jgi:16S rRNA (uracil1498-N3)-methyltransferase
MADGARHAARADRLHDQDHGRGRDRRHAAGWVFVEDPGNPILGDDDAHHLATVLRLSSDEPVVASDGAGAWRWCALSRVSARAPSLVPLTDVQVDPRPLPPVTVAFFPVKGDRPEWAVQKLTELGVDRIVLLHGERSVVRWSGDRAVRALERLRRVAREAAAQCRRTWLPELDGPMSLGALAGSVSSVAMCEPEGLPPTIEHPVLAVGPEGGWGDGERGLGLPTVGLGPLMLRAETAAVTAGVLLCALRAGTVGPG